MRYEKKFLLNFSQYTCLREKFRFLLSKDSHSVKHETYPVFSVYYDNPQFDFYHMKISGVLFHVKIRIRQYSNSISLKNKSYLEIKSKSNQLSYKSRVLLAQDSDIFNPTAWSELTAKNANSDFTLPEVYSPLSPACNVFYERNAYEGYIGTDLVRLNFDKNISFMCPEELEISNHLIDSRAILEPNQYLLEIKTQCEILPMPLKNEISRMNIKQLTFSKYCLALDRVSEKLHSKELVF